ncbi:MAG: hypothetical protein ABIZ18_13250 [Caldimonas sp.]
MKFCKHFVLELSETFSPAFARFRSKLLAIMNSEESPKKSVSSSVNVGAQEMDELEPTSPWRPLLVPAIVVIIGLVIAWAFVAHFGRAKPDASGTIVRTLVYPVDVDAAVAQADAGIPGQNPTQDETILLVQASVSNVSKQPLTIFDLNSDIKLSGENSQSAAAMPEDIDRLMQRFPELVSMRMQPLARHQVIAPGHSAEGLMVFAFPWTKAQWSQRKDAHIIVSFKVGRPLTLPLQ